MVFFPVWAHNVDVKAESIPPLIPITKHSNLLSVKYFESQLEIF
jgi:hypothetical protein